MVEENSETDKNKILADEFSALLASGKVLETRKARKLLNKIFQQHRQQSR